MRVVVVGSGIAGASAAYHLARRGVEVVVVDDEADLLVELLGPVDVGHGHHHQLQLHVHDPRLGLHQVIG